ncbi:MAG: glucose 1-dehydrogenase [Betaproteobacteria bacterium]|nr:glucose 1-dehydrogenase [Betaproteobacteria bacterium]
MGRLDGKVAVITGAGSGIGRAAAVRFATEGAKLVLAGRSEDALRETATLANAGDVIHVAADVSLPEDNARIFEAATTHFGGVDVFVANAGYEGVISEIEDYPVEDFDRVMAINVRGVFLGLKQAIVALRRRGGGSIVITSSIGGIKARGIGNAAYVASKHAEIGMMRTASLECAPHGIRVNCVLPGPIETRMMRSIEQSRSPHAPGDVHDTIAAGIPLRRYGTPEEIANLMLFLASDEAGFSTGGIYLADGGLSAL